MTIPSPEDMPSPIERTYLLVIHIPFFYDETGGVWLERLWHRDFMRHLTYLHQISLAAPAYPRIEALEQDLVRVDPPPHVDLRFVRLPRQDTVAIAWANFPRTLLALWNAIDKAELVHSGLVGWPYPVGWVANCIAILRRKSLVIVVESSPWRLTTDKKGKWLKRMQAAATELVNRWFVNRASISFFTQPSYKESLLTRGAGPGFITPASWISAQDVLTDEAATTIWRTKRSSFTRTKLLFAGRLTEAKGVEILLNALKLLRDCELEVDVDIIGEGPLHARCLQMSRASGEPRIQVLDPIAYGAPFFDLLSRYHVVLIPSLSNEQPRIVFDAYSQAIPVIASDTEGLRPHVFPGRTGWLTKRGDARSLADCLIEAASSPATIERLGLNSINYARTITHKHMHLERWRRLAEHIASPG